MGHGDGEWDEGVEHGGDNTDRLEGTAGAKGQNQGLDRENA